MAAPTGRLAPSPTGRLHLGHARSFLLAWWSVRARGGRMLLRMEDLDAERSRPDLAEGVLRDLEWLGLDWDGPILWQSARAAVYSAALSVLEERGLVYPCVCTRREVEAAQRAPHADEEAGLADGTLRYPGTCRERFESRAAAEARTGRVPALRFRVPEGSLALVDAFMGPFAGDVQAEVGDFPVARRDGLAAYQLAVVVDDAAQGVDEVLRGEDLLPSTLRQAHLQAALGLAHPRWVHVPLVTDAAGRRLAKRADDLSLVALREQGVDPRAVVGWAARSAGMEVAQRLEAREALPFFELARLPREPVMLGLQHLAELQSARL